MVLAEYAFILRVIQMEKRKGDAARRQLRKSVKAVVAANQVGDQGSPAELYDEIEFSIFLSSIALLSFPPFAAHPREQYVFFAPRPQGRRAERRIDAIRTGIENRGIPERFRRVIRSFKDF